MRSATAAVLHDGPTYRPLAEPLHLAAVELTELCALSDQLQDAIARLIGAYPPDPAFLTDAQAADLLSQRLTGLAAFVRALAVAAPSDATADVYTAVMDLTLAEQARRLGGVPSRPVEIATLAPADDDSGDLQLFGD